MLFNFADRCSLLFALLFVWVVITDGNFAYVFITVKEIKIELTPTLQIEPFIGDRHFGESVQLDEVALQRSQSIGAKAMKAALKGKRKADKEREALTMRNKQSGELCNTMENIFNPIKKCVFLTEN